MALFELMSVFVFEDIQETPPGDDLDLVTMEQMILTTEGLGPPVGPCFTCDTQTMNRFTDCKQVT